MKTTELQSRARSLPKDAGKVFRRYWDCLVGGEAWYYFQMERYYDRGGRKETRSALRWWEYVVFAWQFGQGLLLELACAVDDHQWVDCSNAGPDSGDMDMHCSRCGYHFHHQLY